MKFLKVPLDGEPIRLEKLVFAYLKSWRKNYRVKGLFVKDSTIASLLGCSTRSIRRAIKTLKEKDLIVVSGCTINRKIFLVEDLDEVKLHKSDKNGETSMESNRKVIVSEGKVRSRYLGSRGKLEKEDEFIFSQMYERRVKEGSKPRARKEFLRALGLASSQEIKKAWFGYIDRERYNQTELRFYMTLENWLKEQIENGGFDQLVETESDYRLNDFETVWERFGAGVHDNREKAKLEWVAAHRLGELPEKDKILEAIEEYKKELRWKNSDDPYRYKMTLQNFIKCRKWNDLEPRKPVSRVVDPFPMAIETYEPREPVSTLSPEERKKLIEKCRIAAGIPKIR